MIRNNDASWKNHMVTGLLIGGLTPWIGICFFRLILWGVYLGGGLGYADMSMFETWSIYFDSVLNRGELARFLGLGSILNLGAFFLFFKFGAFRSSRGIIWASIVYLIWIAYLKLF